MIVLLATAALFLPGDQAGLDQSATEAYRERDYRAAAALWENALTEAELPAERARLFYNLGNAAYRQERPLVAVGWYTAALGLTPRDRDLWTNLELARSEAGLEPQDRGDLAATTQRLLSSLTRAESEWLLWITLLLWGGCLAGEALRGGRTWRRLCWLGLALLPISWAPLGWHMAHDGEHTLLIVQEGGTQARSEPRSDATALVRLEAGESVVWRDQLPGWVGVRSGGKSLWIRESAAFDLGRFDPK